MMPVLIPGPKQPGNDIDVYLKPLIEDFLLLWKEEGVHMWDAHADDHFNLRALLFVTTNDSPMIVRTEREISCHTRRDEQESCVLGISDGRQGQ